MRKIWCDLGALAGGASFVYGAWLAWHPLGFMVGGILGSAGAIFVAFSDSKGGTR